jgi:DNA anti-recombination protein RmuC
VPTKEEKKKQIEDEPLKNIIERIKEQKVKCAKARDELRALYEELEEIVDSMETADEELDSAVKSLETAVDTMSQYQ